MTELYRVRTALTGFPGGPGVTTMYFLDVATAVASVHTFWTDIIAKFPTDFHAQVENFGDIIEDTTGELTGAWSADAVTGLVGDQSDPYPAPAGAVITWGTDTILDGRRLRGRTFCVPYGGLNYEADGSLAGASITDLQGGGDALIVGQSTSFVIWHRPTGSHAGGNGLVTSCVVHDKVAVLRSRRD